MITKEELDKAFDERFPKNIRSKLRNGKVAIAGLGGLGSNIAVMLARSGIGELLLIDFDIVDITNLNRQMYSIKHLGKPKTEAIIEILKDINPYINYKSVNAKVTPENIKELFKDYEIVCEAFDDPEQKSMLITNLLSLFKDTVIVSGNGMAGYGDSNSITTTKQLSRLYVCGDQTTNAEIGNGLMAPRVAICAGHQANKVIQLLCE